MGGAMNKLIASLGIALVVSLSVGSALLVRAAVRPFVNRAAAALLADDAMQSSGHGAMPLHEFCDDGGGRYRAIYLEAGQRFDVYIDNGQASVTEIKLP